MSASAMWPRSWSGWWVAEGGKAVRVECDRDSVLVTVASSLGGDAYASAVLLDGATKKIERLKACVRVDAENCRYLEIEAGTPEVGPTYRLYAVQRVTDRYELASDECVVAEVVLVPNASIGLYDDWNEDLGVPWAYPLEPFTWATGA